MLKSKNFKLSEENMGKHEVVKDFFIFLCIHRFYSILKENENCRQCFDPITKQICPALNQIPRVASFYFSAAGKKDFFKKTQQKTKNKKTQQAQTIKENKYG